MAAPPSSPTAFRSHLVAERYYDLATCVIILYDHSLTFDMEVENIWKQRWSFPKLLWFVFRYGAPLIQIGSVFGDLLRWSEGACLHWLWARVVGIQILVISVNLVIILRIWALFEKARWTITVMLLAMLGQIIVTIWSYDGLTATVMLFGINGCLPIPKSPDRVRQVASIFIALLAIDSILFTLSIIRIVRLAAKGSSPIPIFQVMLRDGIPYFFIICLVNIGNVLLLELPSIPNELKTLNTEITPVLIVIMISRLFLNLRASANAPSDTNFSLVGNLGEPVQYDRGRIEIRVTTDHVTYTDDVVGSVALEELGRHHSHTHGHLKLDDGGGQRWKSDLEFMHHHHQHRPSSVSVLAGAKE